MTSSDQQVPKSSTGTPVESPFITPANAILDANGDAIQEGRAPAAPKKSEPWYDQFEEHLSLGLTVLGSLVVCIVGWLVNAHYAAKVAVCTGPSGALVETQSHCDFYGLVRDISALAKWGGLAVCILGGIAFLALVASGQATSAKQG